MFTPLVDTEDRPVRDAAKLVASRRQTVVGARQKQEQASDKANVTQDEKKALQFAGKVFLELSRENLAKALLSGVSMEVHCEQDH
ncbi:hypothetical protein [Thioalkalicoccus limnaeus]|uniref:hypothetical protein n=1 Tax=Thioalkalicoccus limnaeus TaxID=120681 RepID=UPI003F74A52E